MRKTLVIGNGFDLHCGLNSSYGDYFETKFTKEVKDFLDDLKKDYESLKNLSKYNRLEPMPIFSHIYFKNPEINRRKIKKMFDLAAPVSNLPIPSNLNDLSFWDLLFYFQKDDIPNEWNDIEKRIKSFVGKEIYLNNCFRPIGESSIYNLVSSTFYNYFDNDRFLKFDDEISFLKKELDLLEKHFSQYLLKNKSSKKNYISDSINFANKLLDMEGLKEADTINILNFNYTNPFEKKYILNHYSKTGIAHPHVVLHVRNIHGTLEEEDTIFGIDPKNVKTTDKSFTFTKTYRQLIGNISKTSNELVFTSTDNEVIFYGHSLSSLDYSYFEAIFDKLNLHDSNARLVFKFTAFSGKTIEEISLDYVDKITKLLEEYASTLENKDHRENLVSRLLLENRISIQEIY
ncbi:AbiH family protein [Enterococcus entomosocium]|uniref:AbiH family protein n=1 Tax=Enterococcus entomosocium TaxID=3034352 RepID=UPI003B58BE2A